MVELGSHVGSEPASFSARSCSKRSHVLGEHLVDPRTRRLLQPPERLGLLLGLPLRGGIGNLGHFGQAPGDRLADTGDLVL